MEHARRGATSMVRKNFKALWLETTKKRMLGKLHLSKRSDVLLAIELGIKLSNQGRSTKVTISNSTMSVPIAPEVWIASGLLLSLVTQIAYVNRRGLK